MRKEKALISLLRGLVDLLAEESSRNPQFSHKLDILLSELPEKKTILKKSFKPEVFDHLPDIHKEWSVRQEADFRLWLQGQPISLLRALIKAEDFDATRRTTKWKDAEKLAAFIADSLQARQARGSSFIGR